MRHPLFFPAGLAGMGGVSAAAGCCEAFIGAVEQYRCEQPCTLWLPSDDWLFGDITQSSFPPTDQLEEKQVVLSRKEARGSNSNLRSSNG